MLFNLAVVFASPLLFMHTSVDHAADVRLRGGLTANYVVTDPAGLLAEAAAHAVWAPGVPRPSAY
ncbi:hypothetical protein [Actinomadura madurae]|uniref:hypothetical protein n=1 Tax=Actinomadura madurae TaxID=1993 RepID=UPI0020275BFB|nr:hypothetical protein [Actinomadura madurae]MCP9955725.1 hypothetical protein [Actinomadura madurae]MCP9972456.1 hypothetical protein [Actinomadura madurae]MCP9984969.1 hypothetical protein [Actinomadura madurae]MCQ0003471.1 hypothetical protein [Actinomadura madurae]MCQ0021168.1 hypothetical protein [Actinomadura madurae]